MSLSLQDRQLITRYMNIARGWLLVGFGALLIALKETYELVEHYEWATWLYWLLVVVMAWAAISITVVSMLREKQLGISPEDRREQ